MTLESGNKSLSVVIATTDADLAEGSAKLPIGVEVQQYNPVEVGLRAALVEVLTTSITEQVNNYLDRDRFLKTLLNFGEDSQKIVVNWRTDPLDSSKLLVKLLQPLDFRYDVGTALNISREVANTVTDTIKLELLPQPDTSLWLRPKNTQVDRAFGVSSQLNTQQNSISNVTLSNFGINLTGSALANGGYVYSSSLLNQWFTDDYKSAELNQDFTNYKNFITYSSAKTRLDAFKQKLYTIETLVTTFDTAALPTASIYLQETSRQNALEKQNIIRGFDPYERYLYYGSGSAYSASADYVTSGTEYHATGSWPRDVSGNLWNTTSSVATSWYDIQSGIAQRYDENNVNLMSNAIPTYLRDDANSAEFITFSQLIGHFFDNIKPYIDQLPNIYDRNVVATKGLSQDLVWDVAKSFGINLTNPDPSASLADFALGNKRITTTELYKRFLHNAPYINRTRGTITSLKALLRIFGLNEQVIGIRETNTTTTGSFEIFDEVTNALNFDTGSYLVLPMSSSRGPVQTLQFRFLNPIKATTTLGVGATTSTSTSWALRLQTSPSASSPWGRIELINQAGHIILSSSYADMFDAEDYYDVMLRYDGSSLNLQVAHSDGEEILYSSSMSTTTGSLLNAWTDTQNFYLGGSGSLSTGNFNGLIDEVRVWGNQPINDATFRAQVLDPGSFVGNDYTQAVENLWIRLSFHSPRNLGATGSLVNESPYRYKFFDPGHPAPQPDLRNITAIGFTSNTTYPYSMDRVTRKVRQFTTNAGAYSYGSQQILIAPPPVFTEVSTDGGLVLHKDRSIVNNNTRRLQQQTKNYIGFFVSPTDAVNNLMIRSLGNVDVNSYLVYSRTQQSYNRLNQVQEYYKQWYNKSINIGEFVRFFDNLAPTLFEQASQLVPAKTTLLTGVVIEPNILEHKKIIIDKPIKLSGANTRRNDRFANTERTYVRDFDITLSTETTVSGSRPRYAYEGLLLNYSASLNMLNNSELTANQNLSYESNKIQLVETGSIGNYYTYNANTLYVTESVPAGEIYAGLLNGVTIELDRNETKADFYYYTSSAVDTINEDAIKAYYNVYDSDIDKQSYIQYLVTYGGMSLDEAERLAIAYTPGNIINVTKFNSTLGNLVPEILPRANFDDPGVVNYFIKNNAIYFFETVQKSIVGQNQFNFLTGSAASWSFGQAYNRNDVVVQAGATSGSAKYYNGKLFRYIDPNANFTSSISYQYPSLDQNKWAPVFYSGQALQTPYRYIFDIYKNPTFENIYELPLTKVSISRPIVEPDRYATKLSFSTVVPNELKSGSLRLNGSVASLFSVNVGISNTPLPSIRVRLYDTAASRDADSNRAFGTDPIGSHGVLLDMKVESGSVSTNVGLFPPPTLVNNDSINPASPIVYYIIEELAGNSYSAGFTTTFNYFAIEAPIQLPTGYLPRHYKFYRDTLLATKRRNYVGCLQTQDTTTDGRSPIEVTLTAGTTITVSPNILQEEDNLGGINLNVN